VPSSQPVPEEGVFGEIASRGEPRRIWRYLADIGSSERETQSELDFPLVMVIAQYAQLPATLFPSLASSRALVSEYCSDWFEPKHPRYRTHEAHPNNLMNDRMLNEGY